MGKEDAAMALSTTLRKVSRGYCAEQPFQLLHILCFLTHPHLVLVYTKTCRQFFPEVDAMNAYNFCIISIDRHHRDSKDLYLVIIHWHQLH